MTRSGRMKPVVGHAKHREQEASTHLASSQAELDAQENQLDALQSYLDEYCTTEPVKGRDTVQPALLANQRRFLGRLQDAISQQEQLVHQSRRTHDTTRDRWQASRARLLALEKVVEGFRAEEDRAEARREQTRLDEISQRETKSRA